jgi:uncharacterized membrane protein
VEVGLTVGASGTGVAVAYRILRDSTPIGVGDVTGSRTAATGVIGIVSIFYCQTSSIIHIDAPSTTSATTYKIQITGLFGAALTSFVNRTGQNDNAGYTAHGSSYIRVYETD